MQSFPREALTYSAAVSRISRIFCTCSRLKKVLVTARTGPVGVFTAFSPNLTSIFECRGHPGPLLNHKHK